MKNVIVIFKNKKYYITEVLIMFTHSKTLQSVSL